MMARKRLFVVVTLGVSMGLFALACDVTDEAAGPAKYPSTAGDGAASSDAMALGDGPTSVPGLCDRVGGYAKVQQLSDALYGKASADCRIGVYFSSMSVDAQSHARECMQRYLGEVFGCGVVYAGSKDSKGEDCRGLQQAHENLVGPDGKSQLNQNDYLAYVTAAQAALKENGLTDNDVASVITVFNNVKSKVAPENVQGTYDSYCTCPGNASGGVSCVPEGGYTKPDTGTKDTGVPDTAVPDTGTVPDTGSIPDADDAG